MPRKRKPPVMMQVEGLSAWVTLSKTEYDDFTGKPITVKSECVRPTRTPESISAYNKRLRDEERKRELETLRHYVQQRDKAYELIRATTNPTLPPLTPTYNQVHTESGLVITIPRKSKAWRRL
jgi:hypothetical protein